MLSKHMLKYKFLHGLYGSVAAAGEKFFDFARIVNHNRSLF